MTKLLVPTFWPDLIFPNCIFLKCIFSALRSLKVCQFIQNPSILLFDGGSILNVTIKRSRDFYIASIVAGTDRKIGWTQICSFHIRRISHISTTYFLTFTGFLVSQQLIFSHWQDFLYLKNLFLNGINSDHFLSKSEDFCFLKKIYLKGITEISFCHCE